jgi:hypothetical protein
MNLTRPLAGFRYVQTQQGQSLQLLALRELGSAARWPEIVNINGLTPPYLTDDPGLVSETVRLYGGLLIVPASAAVDASAAEDPDYVFGVDLALLGGDLVIENGDLVVATGRANLRQALEHRVLTNLGELLFHPDYGNGFVGLRGSGNGPTKALLGARFIKESLLADPRVAAVPDVTAQVTGDSITAVATAHPIAGAPLDIPLTV